MTTCELHYQTVVVYDQRQCPLCTVNEELRIVRESMKALEDARL